VTGGSAGTISYAEPPSLPAVTNYGADFVPVPGNYDSDKATEPAWFRSADASWFIMGQATPLQFGIGAELEPLEHDVPVPADYDGDGRDDMAVYRPTDGTFHVLGRGQIADLPIGFPAPADYDGDRSDEPAVFRLTEDRLYIDDGPTLDFTLGMSEGLPVPADYDGDGSDDAALWNYDTPDLLIFGEPTVQLCACVVHQPVTLRPWLIPSIVRLTCIERNDVQPGDCVPPA
jgi:hypothetical protein